jgi:hypothetical protein
MMKAIRFLIILFFLVVLAGTSMAGVEPSPFINFQGVLRDSGENPLDGGHDMSFHFYDAPSFGNEILRDEHMAVGTGDVSVSGGMFGVVLGGGDVWDGAGPGVYNHLGEVFRDHAEVYLEIRVFHADTAMWETLSPRTPVRSGAYAMNADQIDGTDSGQLLRSDEDDTFSSGILTIGGGAELDAVGHFQSGSFFDRDDNDYYLDPTAAHSGRLGGDLSIGYDVSFGDDFLYFQGDTEFLSFDSTDNRFEFSDELAIEGPVQIGYISTTPVPYNRIGSYTPDSDSINNFFDLFVSTDLEVGDSLFLSGYLFMNGQNTGSESNQYIYFFEDGSRLGEQIMWSNTYDEFRISDDVYITGATRGVEAEGSEVGGLFEHTSGASSAWLARSSYGMQGYGDFAGGYFQDDNDSGYAFVGYLDYGIYGVGRTAGGYFDDPNHSGKAWVGYGDRGIWAKGTFAGGTFSHPDNLTFWADVSTSTHKIVGTGAVSFVQNHPEDADHVIVYAAPEGDEVATYTRGTARLTGGIARVPLGETFRWVTNPDIGLTAYVTPVGTWSDLYIESKTATELVIRSLDGDPEARFDYIVYGLRLGFEEAAVVQEKEKDAFLPSQEAIQEDYLERPDLRAFNSLERFRGMRAAAGITGEPDLTRSRSMVAALEGQRAEAMERLAAQSVVETTPVRPTREGEDRLIEGGEAEVVETFAPKAAAPSQPVAPVTESDDPGSSPYPLLPASGTVRPGDVLVLDRVHPGSVRTADLAMDVTVAGCAVSPEDGFEIPSGQVAVGATGIVRCRADAGEGAIAVGDLLTTSGNPGHAMRAGEYAQGAVLGKAVEPLAEGTGLIRVLVVLR